MLNLEENIAAWRQHLLAAGINAPAVLDELESHLREDMERQTRSGSDARQAFEIAAQRIGEAHVLRTEFEKASETPAALRKLMGFICVFFLGFISLLSGFTFYKMEMSLGEQIVAFAAVAFCLLAACGWRYAVPLLPIIPNRRKRLAAGWTCIASGLVCSNLFCQFVLPPFERKLDGQIPAIGFWAVVPIAVFTCLGVGLMMSVRDREFWGMNKVVQSPATPPGS